MLFVYSLPNCVVCRRVVSELEKIGVSFVERELGDFPDVYDRVLELGVTSAPVVFSGEDFLFSGYDGDLIDSLVFDF